MLNRKIPSIAAILTEIAVFYNIFIFFSYDKTGKPMNVDYLYWAIGSIIILFLNRKISTRLRTIQSVVIINSILIIAWLVLGGFFFFNMEGFWPRFWATLLVGITGIRAGYIPLQEITEQQALMRTEVSYMAAGFFFMTQIGPFKIPMIFNIPSFVMIAANMMALINLRIFTQDVKSVSVSKWKGLFFMTALLTVLGAVTASVLIFISPSFGDVFLEIIYLLKSAVIWVLKGIERILSILFANIKGEIVELPPPSNINGLDLENAEQLQINLFDKFVMVGIIISIITGIYLFIKFRKKFLLKYKGQIFDNESYIKIKRAKENWLLKYIKILWGKIKFVFIWMNLRNTLEGTFLTIEKIGKKKGIPRRISETPGSYLQRLMGNTEDQFDLGKDEIKQSAYYFSRELEKRFYGRCNRDSNNSIKFKTGDLKRIKSFFRICIVLKAR